MVLKIIEKFHSVVKKNLHQNANWMQIQMKIFLSFANCFKPKRNRTKANQNKTRILKINEKFNSVKREDFFHIKMQIG